MKTLLLALITIASFTSGCGSTPATTGSATVFDRFNRSDSAATMGTAETGQNWGTYWGGWGIASNEAYPLTSNASYATVDTKLSDGTVTVQLATNQANNGIIFRLTDGQSYWYAGTDNARTGYLLGKFVASSSMTVVTQKAISVGDGDLLAASMSGSSISVSVNGSQILTATDGFNQTATQHGIGVLSPVNASSRFKNFIFQ